MLEIAIDLDERPVLAHRLEQVGAHRNERARSSRRAIEAAKEFLPARLGGVVERRRRGLAAGRAPARDRVLDPLRVRPEIVRPGPKQRCLVAGRKAAVAREDLAGERHARGLAPSGQQGPARLGERSRAVFHVARPGRQLEHRTPALGDRSQKVGEESAVHRVRPHARRATPIRRSGEHRPRA